MWADRKWCSLALGYRQRARLFPKCVITLTCKQTQFRGGHDTWASVIPMPYCSYYSTSFYRAFTRTRDIFTRAEEGGYVTRNVLTRASLSHSTTYRDTFHLLRGLRWNARLVGEIALAPPWLQRKFSFIGIFLAFWLCEDNRILGNKVLGSFAPRLHMTGKFSGVKNVSILYGFL